MRKEEAAQFIGVSVRTLQRLTQKGEIPVTYTPGKKGDEAHYDDQELLNYLSRNKPASIIRPNAAPLAAVPHDAPSDMTSGVTNDAASNFLAALSSLAAPVRLSEKLLLSIPEASAVSGISVDKLRADAKLGKLKTVKSVGRGLGKVRKDDLEKYVNKLH
jgi:excisionase family DNA binding protein